MVLDGFFKPFWVATVLKLKISGLVSINMFRQLHLNLISTNGLSVDTSLNHNVTKHQVPLCPNSNIFIKNYLTLFTYVYLLLICSKNHCWFQKYELYQTLKIKGRLQSFICRLNNRLYFQKLFYRYQHTTGKWQGVHSHDLYFKCLWVSQFRWDSFNKHSGSAMSSILKFTSDSLKGI